MAKLINNCPYCDTELESLGISLDDSEVQDFEYSNSVYNAAKTALDPNVVNRLNFSDEEAARYFSSAFNQMAKGTFLQWSFIRDLKKRHNIDPDINVFIYGEEVYKHG